MHYVLIDSHGTSLDSYEDRRAALRSYAELVERDPSAEEDVAVLEVDDDGVARSRLDTTATTPTVV